MEICWFCKVNEANPGAWSGTVDMYLLISTEWIGHAYEQKFEKATVQVPICKRCSRYQWLRILLTVPLVLLFLAAFFYILYLSWDWLTILDVYGGWGFIATLIIIVFAGLAAFFGGIGIGFELGRRITKSLASKEAGEYELAYEHPKVKEMQAKGWKIGSRPPKPE